MVKQHVNHTAAIARVAPDAEPVDHLPLVIYRTDQLTAHLATRLDAEAHSGWYARPR